MLNIVLIIIMISVDDGEGAPGNQGFKDGMDCILDIREYDVPYLARIAIDFGRILFHTSDMKIRLSRWSVVHRQGR